MSKFNMQDCAIRPAARPVAPPVARIWLIALLALTVLVTGCSSLRLSYNHGDTLLYWWLDGYVDLASGQKDDVREDIGDLLAWHRKTQLKNYVQLLETGQRQLQGNPTQADLQANVDAVKANTEVLLVKAVPDLADLARALQPAQIASMEKKFASTNADFRKKFMSGNAEKRQNVRYEKSLEQFETWFGSFSREQETIIRKLSDARPQGNQLWLDERVLRQKNIIALLHKVQREKTDKQATEVLIQNLIKNAFARLEQSEHKAFFDASNAATTQMVVKVIAIATPVQKTHAQQRMQGWIDDFNSLAAEAR
jgi:hypothetical protein